MFPKDTNILIVDDVGTMRKLMKWALGELGFTKITDASDGAEAFDKVKAAHESGDPFQLVISDLNMPNCGGIDFLKNVRQVFPQLPFVILTAESEKGQVMDAIQARVNGYIVKPFTTAHLGDKLSAVYDSIYGKKTQAA
jgi:two-component system chemotaxis response regulator CheY